MIIKEETAYEKGTLIQSKWGPCRVRYIYKDKVSVILDVDDKPLNSSADFWMKIVDNKLEDW